ncbi:unnamed protein product [Rotaria magnacalcarata]|uniref:Uncharacterized protein n=1 Tax=Rotaria magnacalcarata TaxID=392030 RepID=A0A8S2SLP7_9BILA|nr:unnamed protein product [Rotaria magnacalcarata]
MMVLVVCIVGRSSPTTATVPTESSSVIDNSITDLITPETTIAERTITSLLIPDTTTSMITTEITTTMEMTREITTAMTQETTTTTTRETITEAEETTAMTKNRSRSTTTISFEQLGFNPWSCTWYSRYSDFGTGAVYYVKKSKASVNDSTTANEVQMTKTNDATESNVSVTA